MVAPANQYLRVGSASAGALNVVEAEKVQDLLNNMHPAVAPLHSIFDQPGCDSVKPIYPIDFHDIDRSSTAATLTAFALGPGQATTVQAPKYPAKLFTRLQTYHEGVAASRESQQIRLYGVTDALDYGIDNLLVRHMDIWERILHFSQGTENATGSSGTPANPIPRTQGLYSWCAWLGLELRHGDGTPTNAAGDGLQSVRRTYWPSMFDAAGAPLDRDLFYNQILGPAWNRGHDSDGAMVLCPPKMMNRFADFNFVPGRGVINERTIPARDEALIDHVSVITTPANGTLWLCPDRVMGAEGASIAYNNTAFPLGSGGLITDLDNQRGSINRTIFVDETILSVIPSKFKIETMQGIAYKPLATDGDYALGMVVAQKGLSCKNLFGIAGGTNLVP